MTASSTPQTDVTAQTPRFKRVLVTGLGGSALLLLATVGLVGAVYATRPCVRVQVQEHEGLDLSLRVPAFLVRTALAFVPSRVFDEAAREMDEVLPLASIASRELGDCPDGILLHVQSGDEDVTVQIRDRELRVNVATRSEQVTVGMPIHLVQDVVRRLERS